MLMAIARHWVFVQGQDAVVRAAGIVKIGCQRFGHQGSRRDNRDKGSNSGNLIRTGRRYRLQCPKEDSRQGKSTTNSSSLDER